MCLREEEVAVQLHRELGVQMELERAKNAELGGKEAQGNKELAQAEVQEWVMSGEIDEELVEILARRRKTRLAGTGKGAGAKASKGTEEKGPGSEAGSKGVGVAAGGNGNGTVLNGLEGRTESGSAGSGDAEMEGTGGLKRPAEEPAPDGREVTETRSRAHREGRSRSPTGKANGDESDL